MARRNKHNAEAVRLDGYYFPSKLETTRYLQLRLLEKAGEIIGLTVHPRYLLQLGFAYEGEYIPSITYEADFAYYDNREKISVVEEVKGYETALYKLKRKLFIKVHVIPTGLKYVVLKQGDF